MSRRGEKFWKGGNHLSWGKKSLPGGPRVKENYTNTSTDTFLPYFNNNIKKHFQSFSKSKSSSAAVRTGLRPVKAHVTLVHFDYNSKSSKYFHSISTSYSVPFKFLHAIIHQMKVADFQPNSSS